MSSPNKTVLLGALIGGLIGAATALLSTPCSGAKLRRKILDGFPSKTAKPANPTSKKKAARLKS